MARQDNPFALLGDDDEGADVSVLVAKLEAKMPVVLPVVAEESKKKVHELPSKLPFPTDYERGRGRGGRGRGPGRGGFGDVGGTDGIEQPYNGYYRGSSVESGGSRGRGRGRGGGVGRGRGVAGFASRNQLDYDNIEGVEGGADSQEKVYNGERLPLRYESRNFVDERHEKDGEEREPSGFMEYDGRENRGFRGYAADRENDEHRDGEGHEDSGYGGDRENHGFKAGVGHEGRSYGGDRENRGFNAGVGHEGRRYGGDRENHGFNAGVGHEGRSYGGDRENRGFRGGEGRGRMYGARGRRGGRNGELGGAQYVSNGRRNVSETKDSTSDEKDPIANNSNNENGGFGSVDSTAAEAPKNEHLEKPKNEQLEKPIPDQISSEDTSKVLEEEDKEMTLAEYEKLLQEKRKALESLKVESRKVVLDKDFEGMLIVEKKKDHDLIKKSENDKGKKKEISERDEKSRKALSINEFLKPADGESYRGPTSSRGRGGRGRGRGGYMTPYPSRAAAPAPALEDPSHFPILAPVAKA